MAKFEVNDVDVTDKLKGFSLVCEKCGSDDVVLSADTKPIFTDEIDASVFCNPCNEFTTQLTNE